MKLTKLDQYMKNETLTLGVPKGRLMKEAVALFARSGIDISISKDHERSVLVPTSESDLQLCPVRSRDIPLLLEAGVLDIAIIGSDTFYEVSSLRFREKRDLDICKCRLSVIGCSRTVLNPRCAPRPRVATKYPQIAREYFEVRGMLPEIIKMNGSVEVALLTGLAPFVVDIVSTGDTIARNNLVELEVIRKVSAYALLGHTTLGYRRQRCNDLLDLILSPPQPTSAIDSPLTQAAL